MGRERRAPERAQAVEDGVAALLREKLQDARRSRKEHPATFSRYYESRDSKLCVFEDENGHFTSVRVDRLA